MGDKPRDPPPVIKGDKLILDFGKRILRPEERPDHVRTERKLPPVPGRVPDEESVPEDQVLNPTSKVDRGE
jgi:hypothetical protein